MSGIRLPFKDLLGTTQAVHNLAKTAKNSPTAGLIRLTFVSRERAAELFRDADSDLVMMRADGPLSLIQLHVPAVGSDIGEGWSVAIEGARLLGALRYMRSGKPEHADISVDGENLVVGSAVLTAREPSMFPSPSRGITHGDQVGVCPNPFDAVNRVAHCATEDSIPSIGLLPGQLLGVRRSQSILVDCEIIPATSDLKAVTPIRELARVEHLGDTVHVRMSREYLVLKSDADLLAIRTQRWRRSMDDALRLFESPAFVGEIAVDRESLLDAIRSARQILGRDNRATLRVAKGSAGTLEAVDESASVNFAVQAQSESSFKLSFVIGMLDDAVTHSPEPEIVIKIPDLGSDAIERVHLVDSESHEVIGLGMVEGA